MRFAFLIAALCGLSSGCQRQEAAPPATTGSPAATAAPAVTTRPKPVKPPDALASQNTNWGSTVADVLEVRRRGNVLTVVGRLRNPGLVQLFFPNAYLLDETQGRKYKALTDETGEVIACCNGTTAIAENQTLNFWVKFPAPPPDVKAVTFVLPETTPFENLTIQDQ